MLTDKIMSAFYKGDIILQIQKVFIDSQYMVQQLEQQTPVCH